jgi:hypothetical protein
MGSLQLKDGGDLVPLPLLLLPLLILQQLVLPLWESLMLQPLGGAEALLWDEAGE